MKAMPGRIRSRAMRLSREAPTAATTGTSSWCKRAVALYSSCSRPCLTLTEVGPLFLLRNSTSRGMSFASTATPARTQQDCPSFPVSCATRRSRRGRSATPCDSPRPARVGLCLARAPLRVSSDRGGTPAARTTVPVAGGFRYFGFSRANQVILRALQIYGMILADNGSPWFLSGAPNAAWNNDQLRELQQIKGSDFEAVDVSSLIREADSGQVSGR